jgi:hypothetical protein
VGPSLQNPKKTADKFAGSLIFWVGLSLQNPKKTAEKSEFQFFLDKPVLQIPTNCGKYTFQEFFGSPKNCGKPQKIHILKPVHRGKTAKNFWTSPSFKIMRHGGKIRLLRLFLGPLKAARNRGKIQILEVPFSKKIT